MGKRILDYPITQDIDDNDYVLLDGVNGTRKIQAKKLQKALMYLTDTGNSQNHLDDWSEPTFDPING